MIVTLTQYKQHIRVPLDDPVIDDQLTRLLHFAQGTAEKECGYQFDAGARTDRLRGDGRTTIYLSHAPLTSITTFTRGLPLGGATPIALTSPTDYVITSLPDARLDVATPLATSEFYEIQYQAGPQAGEDLQTAILLIGGALYTRAGGSEGLQQVSASGITQTRGDITQEARYVLDRYRRRWLA